MQEYVSFFSLGLVWVKSLFNTFTFRAKAASKKPTPLITIFWKLQVHADSNFHDIVKYVVGRYT